MHLCAIYSLETRRFMKYAFSCTQTLHNRPHRRLMCKQKNAIPVKSSQTTAQIPLRSFRYVLFSLVPFFSQMASIFRSKNTMKNFLSTVMAVDTK